jgi:hypothetical protein
VGCRGERETSVARGYRGDRHVAGPFTSIGGRSRKHLGALDAVDGTATRWDPAPDDVVRALLPAPDGTQLVVAGDFERVGGGRRDVASFELASGYVTDWRPVASAPASEEDVATEGRLRIQNEIARGGMGAIMRARDQQIQRDVAVKFLLNHADPCAGR